MTKFSIEQLGFLKKCADTHPSFLRGWKMKTTKTYFPNKTKNKKVFLCY